MRDTVTIAFYFIQSRWIRRLRSRRAVERLQERYIRKHFRFLRKASPYFSHLPEINTISDLEALPMMDKAVMMENFNQMNTRQLDRDTALEIAIKSEKTRDFEPTYNGVSVGLSSGTSGHRGLFVVSDHERAAWAGTVLAKFLPPGRLTGHRIAFFLRANNNVYETVRSRSIEFRYFDIYLDMENHVETLGSYQPTVLVAPPSVISVLADAVENETLSINPMKIIAVAEVLSEFDEQRFRRVFRQDFIHQAYQCTEGFLAHTCHRGSFHLNEDIVHVEKEFLDHSRFIPIITDFRRTTQPIVRYRLNDVLVLAEKQCDCGSATTVIERVEGREDDTFIFHNQAGDPVPVYPDMIGRCLLYVPKITNYRIVQTSYSEITVEVSPLTLEIEESISQEFSALTKKMGVVLPRLRFAEFSADYSSKLRRVVRDFSPK